MKASTEIITKVKKCGSHARRLQPLMPVYLEEDGWLWKRVKSYKPYGVFGLVVSQCLDNEDVLFFGGIFLEEDTENVLLKNREIVKIRTNV